MLEEPRPHDVGGHLGEDPALLVALLLLVGVVVVPGAGRGHAVVQTVTCQKRGNTRTHVQRHANGRRGRPLETTTPKHLASRVFSTTEEELNLLNAAACDQHTASQTHIQL